jgi:crossover junction endodeoxyribonuclease RuvC
LIILGFDPGSRKMGYAVLKVQGRKILYLDSGVLRFDHIASFIERPAEIYEASKKIVMKCCPDEIACETPVYTKSPTALIKLSQARGALLAAVAQTHRGRIFEYSPNLIKATVTGHGLADKDNVRKCLDMLIGKVTYATHDESDAVAIAFCHAIHRTQAVGLSVGGTLTKLQKSKKSTGLAACLEHMISKGIGP